MASFEEYAKKLDKKYGSAKKTDKEVQQQNTEAQKKFSSYSKKLEQKYSVPEVTDSYITVFLSDAKKYLDSAESDYNKLNFNNSSSVYESRKKAADDLRSRSWKVRQYLEKNKTSYEAEDYDSLMSYLDAFDKASSQSKYAFYKNDRYYSQWDTEDDYNKYLQEQKDYEDLVNFDLDAGEKEVKALETILEEYDYLIPRQDVQNPDSEFNVRLREIRGQYGSKDDIEKLISEKNAYLNRAKHIQEGIALSGVIDSADFDANNDYVSTQSDKWWSRLTSDYGMGYDDLTYEYINGAENGMRSEIRNKAVSYKADNSLHETDRWTIYDHMTEDEIGIYNYYYSKDGKEAAEKYLDSIQETLNHRKATSMYKNMENKTLLELAFGVAAGLDQFESGVKNLLNTKDDYIPVTATQIASGMVREDLEDEGPKLPDWMGGASLGQAAYDTVTTTANMAPSMLTSIAIGSLSKSAGTAFAAKAFATAGQVAGNTMMFASAAGNAYQEALNHGYDKRQARAYSNLVGASEAGLQYLLGGISSLGGKASGAALTKMLDGIDNAFARTALQLGGNMLSEGFEEGLQEILTPLFKSWKLRVDEDINWSEVAYSGLLGALTAGFMEGPTTIAGEVKTYQTGKQLQAADISAQRLAEIGKTFSADTVAYQLAGRVNENTGAYTMGRLFNEIGATLSEQNVTEITNALVAKGMDQATAKKNAEALAYVVEGGQLSERQIAAIEANDVLAEVARTTLIDANTTWNQRSQGYNEVLKALADEMASPKASRTKAAQQGKENTPAADMVDARTENGTEVLSEADSVDTSPAKVQSISAIKNGQATIKLEDGSEVDVKKADLDPDDGVRIETIASIEGITASDANSVLNTLRTSTNASAQMDSLGAKEAYKYGFYGLSLEHLTKHGVFANSLADTQRQAIYEIGRKARQQQIESAAFKKGTGTGRQTEIYFDAGNGNVEKFTNSKKMSTMTDKQKAGVQAAMILRKLGIGGDIYFFESYRNSKGQFVYKDKHGNEVKAPNGWYEQDGSIHIDLNAGTKGQGFILFTLAHELTHFIEQWSPQKYKILADFLVENYEKGQSMDKLVRAKQAKLSALRGEKVSYKEAYSEVIADSMEAMLADGNVMEKLIELKAKDNSLFMKMKQFFDNLLTKIRNIYKGQTPDSAEGRAVLEMTDSIEKIQQLFADALVEASENFQTAEKNTTQEGGVQYSFIGRTADGLGIYKTNYPLKTPKSVKQADLIKLVQDVWSSKPITLTIVEDGRYVDITAKFNPELKERSDLSKIAFGNRKGRAAEQRMTLDLASDLYQIASEARFNYSKDATPKPNNPAHDGVTKYHYFLTNLVYKDNEGNYIQCHMNIDVKRNAEGDWFYSFAIEKGSVPQTLLAAVTEDSATLPNDNVPDIGDVVKSESVETLVDSGIAVDSNTDSGSIFSVRDVLDDTGREKVAAALVDRFGVTKEEAMKWLTAETSLASLILNPKYSSYLDYAADPSELAIKQNSDYPQGTVDFSNICKKRREFTQVMNRILRNFPNHVFAATDLAKIRTIMGEEGMTLPCGICYVEDRRQLDTIVAQDFIDGLKLYREGSKTRPDGKPFNANQLKGLQLTDGDTYVPTIYELVSLEGRNSLKAKNPNMEAAWVRYNNARGMQSVRLLTNEAEYKRQILKYTKNTVQSKNDKGGLRIYSFSDAEMFHLIDIIQVITDSAAVGLYLQGYTKVNEYAKAVKDTGEKLNRSLIPLGDLGYHIENGKVVLDYDTVEGIDIYHEDFFDNKDNPNVGNITIGINDIQIRAAMVSDFVDQIIPFHTGQSEEVLGEKGIAAWNNYKDFQTEKDLATGKTSSHQVNIYTEVFQAAEKEGKPIQNKRQFVEKFLQVCKENDLQPRFSQFLNTDAQGNYIYTEGYHKFLVDFKTFAQTEVGEYLPQGPVKPIFEDTYITGLLKAYVKEQKAKDADVAKQMPKVIERITNEIIKPTEVQRSDRDSDGNQISVEQQEFFKYSVVRDSNGKLMVMYHGTSSGGAFTVFEGDKLGNDSRTSQVGQGFYFTNVKKEAEAYTKDVDIYGKTSAGRNPHLHQVYLNITNPFDVNADTMDIEKVKSVYMDGTYDYFFSDYIPFYLNKKTVNGRTFTKPELQAMSKTEKVSAYVDYLLSFGSSDYAKAKEVLSNMVRAFPYGKQSELLASMRNRLGCDGIVEEFKPGQYQYVAFSSEQVKAVDNQSPTSDPDIRYSDRDYMDAVNRGDMETAQRMVEKAAKQAGYDSTVYHGTPAFGFTKIKTEGVEDGMEWSPFFTTDSLEVAETYSGKNKVRGVSDNSQDENDAISEAFHDRAYDLCDYINRAAGHQSYISYDAFDLVWEDAANGTMSLDTIRNGFYEDVESIVQELFAYSEFYEKVNDPDVDQDELYDQFVESSEIDRIYSAANDIDFILRAARTANSGNYQFYANTDNLLELDAKGNSWSRIPFDEYDKNGFHPYVNTRQASVYAKQNGFDGVKVTNVFDDGGRSLKKQRTPATVYIFFKPHEQVKSADPVTYDDSGKVIPLSERFNQANDDIRYSERVTDQDTLDFLNKQIENGEYITVYRSFQVIDGGLYAPMNAVDRDEDGKNKRLGYRSELWKWEKATESPEIAQRYMDKHPNAKWASFDLDGVDNKTSGVAYNPYLHASNLVLNDQFSAAYRRNLVTVECRVPVSEVGAYHAKYAKDTTGWVEWKPGGVAGKLMKVKPEYTRKLFVSRYMLPVRIIPDSEVAQMYKEYLDGTNIQVPWNVVTPSLRKELVKAGVSISYKDVKGSNYTRVFSEIFPDDASEAVRYSDRDTDSVSNRSLLANALEGVAQNDIEKQKIQEYKGKISLINAEEQKLSELNEKIKELSFSKGPRDTKAIRDLQFEARQTANRINVYDKQLLRLEASKPLQDVLTREKKMAYKRAEQKGKEALEAYRERTMKTQRELLEKWQTSRKKGIESRHKTAMRHKIKDVVNELNQYLLRGTKDRHVPIELQKAVAEALDAVNMDTVGAEERIAKLQDELLKAKTPEQIQEISRKIDHIQEMGERMNGKLQKLKDAYDQFVNSDDPLIANSHDEVISNKLQSVIETVGDTPLRDMTLSQLEDVYDMYRMVLTTIRNANKAFKAKKSESISVIANQVMVEVEKVGGKKQLAMKGMDGIKSFMWNNLKPVYAFEHIGSDHFTEVFNNVRDGEDVWALDVTEAREFYLDKSKKHNYDSWDFKKRYNFTSTSGMIFELNLEQIMSLYAYSKRDQAADHLKKGGIVIDETTEITVKNKLGIPVKFNPTEATAYNISEETLADIISKLTDEQKAFADEMQDYLSTVMGAKGNEVSLVMYGVKLFKEKFYFPLKSAHQFMAKAKEQAQGDVKIKNSGFSKETVQKASNPIVLTPFMNVWANHVNEMSMYHAFVLPMEDFYRVYNYKTPTSDTMATESVEMFIQNAYGKGATKYIDQLLKDLNGGARTDSTTGIINKMTGLFKKGAVFASLSVVVQQPSAIARAAALLDTKYFIGPKVDHKRHKALWDEVKRYAPVAIIKEMGYFDTNMGKSTQDFILGKEYSGFAEKMKALVTDSGYRDEVLSKAPALADELAWCSIWEAVKRETKAKYPGLDTKAEPFLKLCGSRFTEVIVKTQVYDSALSRSALMRSKDTGMKMATAFMAEPTTSINMVADALLKGKRGDRKYARAAIGAVIASQILNSILVSFVYAGRDDDEDETYLEKYIGTLSGEILDSLNPAGYIPFIKDIMSIVQGYDVERSDMAVISDLWTAWQNLSKDNVSTYRKVEGFAGSIAQIFGLPVKNIMRDARGIYQTINSFVNGQQTTKAGIGYAVKGAVTGKDVTNQQQLYEAYMSGDKTQIARVEGRYESQTAINSAIRKALRENDPRIHDAAVARSNGNISEYTRIAKSIIAEGHFSQDNVVAAINAEINAMAKGETTSSNPKASGLYKAEDFALAISQGDSAMANAIKTDIIQTAQKNGKTAEEAEKSFVSSAKGDLKELYIAGSVTEAQAIDALTTYCGDALEDAEKRVSEWGFEQDYGFSWSDRADAYKSGKISAQELQDILVNVGGKTDEEAMWQVKVYDWQNEGFDIDSNQKSVVEDYETYCEPAGIDKNTYFDAYLFYADAGEEGVAYSKTIECMPYIDSLPLSSSQKTALALCWWAKSTVNKYKTW